MTAAQPSPNSGRPPALSPAELRKLTARLEKEAARRIEENALQHYRPYARQLDFHAAGATHRERLLMAGNQLGKTWAGGMEVAMHACGRYPDWWVGKRFNGPTNGWVAGVTGETVRDTVQRVLIGRDGAHGKGAIPKDAIADLVPARGVPGLMDTIRVRHVNGGGSSIGLKSYEKGREKFQGETLDWCWLDEEPDISIYTEVLTRTNVAAGPIFLTFTPLLGVSGVVSRFLHEKSPDRSITAMTIHDAAHFTEEERKRIIASYPKHEVEARTLGIPVLGSGRIFPVEESLLRVPQREIPEHWPRIGGLDFGWSHPSAAVEIAWDRDTDTVYVIRCMRISEVTPVVQAATLKKWGKRLQFAWPRDGRRETLEGAGQALADQYRKEGLDLLHDHSQYQDGSVSVEAGIMDMLIRMEAGRFKVFDHLLDWWEEFRLYHRRDGKVYKERDDIMSATRYAIMMLRYARVANPKPFVMPRHSGGSWMAN
jgi:phage terminase large subunit-like protein